MSALVARLHIITDETLQQRFSHVELARLAAEGGADVVQYREKRHRTTRERVEVAVAMREALEGIGTVLLVNDRVDVAAAAAVSAVHLGRDDLDPVAARRILGPDATIGGTANSLDEALRVAATPVDYVGVGPVFGTQSKANPAPVLGLDCLAEIVRAIDKPVIAIGNITADRVADVLSTGAHGIAVLSAVVMADDPAAATRALREAIDAALKESVRA